MNRDASTGCEAVFNRVNPDQIPGQIALLNRGIHIFMLNTNMS